MLRSTIKSLVFVVVGGGLLLAYLMATDKLVWQAKTSKVTQSDVTQSETKKTSQAACVDEQLKSVIEVERLHVQLAQMKTELADYQEVKQLLRFQTDYPQMKFSLAKVLRPLPDASRHVMNACLVSQGDRAKVKSGDLVVAQGFLVAEVIKTDQDCFEALMVSSDHSSFEIQLTSSGIRGVAVGLGDESEEETRGANLRIKYLERTSSAVIGEQAVVVRRFMHTKYRALPQLIIGDVIRAHREENGLFQSAALTLPFRRETIKWVLVISLSDSAAQ